MNFITLTQIRKFVIIGYLYLCAGFSAAAITDSIPERPSPPRLVNNFSKQMPDFLSQGEQAQLEKKLSDFANQTSNQIVIVIVDDLAGLESYDYATRLGQKWKVGQKGFDNGIVILIKPTGGQGQRKYFIATGYGLGGVIPDLTCRQIEENELLPGFKNKQYFDALDKTTDVIMALAKGEYNSDKYGEKHSHSRFPKGLIMFIIIIIVFVIISATKGGGGRGGMSMGSGFFLGSMLGGRGFGGGGGSWGGGGSSGGGFGGFGGGGFGGGGSGGSW